MKIMVMQRILTILLCGILHNPSRVAVHAFVATGSSSSSSSFEDRISSGESYSTLTLLEHMHLLSPYVHTKYATHDDINIEEEESKSMVDLFVQTMGFGLDPKGVDNVKNEAGVAFVNCGASQLHLNDDSNYCKLMEAPHKELEAELERNNIDIDQPAFEIGLRYKDLSLLKEQLSYVGDLASYAIEEGPGGRETVRVSNMYVARETTNASDEECDEDHSPTISSLCQQKVIYKTEEEISQYGSDIVEKYGVLTSQSNCLGIDYIEFFVPVSKDDNGKTIEKIAKFYDFFFDAITTAAFDGTSHIAIIGFGKIDENGRAEQSLLFRERVCDNPPKAGGVVNDPNIGTGHHIAMYVGANDDDFEAAAENCMAGGLLWVNQLFEDRVLNVESALKEKQFRFKDIIDIETGEVLYALEHEIRSISHDLFPGGKQ